MNERLRGERVIEALNLLAVEGNTEAASCIGAIATLNKLFEVLDAMREEVNHSVQVCLERARDAARAAAGEKPS